MLINFIIFLAVFAYIVVFDYKRCPLLSAGAGSTCFAYRSPTSLYFPQEPFAFRCNPSGKQQYMLYSLPKREGAEVKVIEVYVDGASAGDPGPSGAGIFIKGHGKGEQLSIPLGMMTNHEAEYHALIKGLEICLEKGFSIVSVRTDSQLVQRAVEKEYVKNQAFIPLLEKVIKLSSQFDLFFIKWVPSKQNSVADQLSKAAIRMNAENKS